MRGNQEWCYASGRVSVLGSALLGEDFFMGIIASETLEDIYRIIADSPVKAYLSSIDDLFEVESILSKYYQERLADITNSLPDPAIGDLFRLKYDLLNLKNYIKEKVLLIPCERHPLGDRPDDYWRGLWEGDEASYPEIFRSTLTILKKNIDDGASAAIVIDPVIDNLYLRSLLLAAKETGSSMIERFFRRYQLVRGIEVIWRALLSGRDREMIPEFLFLVTGLEDEGLLLSLTHISMDKWPGIFPDYLPKDLCRRIFIGSPSEMLKTFIKLMDEYLFQETQGPIYIPFGPEQVFLYLTGLTREVYNLGLAIRGRMNRVPSSLIEERFRKIYV